MKFSKLVMPDKNAIDREHEQRIRRLAKEVKLYSDCPKTTEETIKRIGDADAIITSWVEIDKHVIDSCPNLRYIGVMATGYDKVDAKAAAERGITVTNVPHYSTESVAEIIIGALVAMARRLVKADNDARNDAVSKEELFGEELRGKTAGIIGLGAIGRRVAELASAFGMKVIYNSRTRKDVPYEFCSMDDVLKRSDVVSINYSLTPETEGLIGDREFALMKDGAIFINFARGRATDEKALLKHVRNGRIRAIIDDVYDKEVKKGLIKAGTAILTPHIGFYTKEAIGRLTETTIENMESFLKGNVQNRVN